jgi:hypothetical protein
MTSNFDNAHGAGARRPGFDELHVDPVFRCQEERRTATQNDRMNDEPEFVDQAEPHDLDVLAGLGLQLRDFFGDVALQEPAVHPTLSSVVETTTLGMSFQMRAYSTSGAEADGSLLAQPAERVRLVSRELIETIWG